MGYLIVAACFETDAASPEHLYVCACADTHAYAHAHLIDAGNTDVHEQCWCECLDVCFGGGGGIGGLALWAI